MGYYVDLFDSNVVIPKENLDDAFQAMCRLNWNNDIKSGGRWPRSNNANNDGPREDVWFSWMAWNYHETCSDAADILATLGFDVDIDPCNGDLILYGYSDKVGDEQHFFAAIASFIPDASYMCWRGEDGAMWRYYFNNGTMELQYAEIHWG